MWNCLLDIHTDGLQNLCSILCQPLKSKVLDYSSCFVACQSLYVILDLLKPELENSKCEKLRSQFSYFSWFVFHCLMKIQDYQLRVLSMKIFMKLLNIHSKLNRDWHSEVQVMSKLIRPLTSTLIDICVENEGTELFTLSLECLDYIIIENDNMFTKEFLRLIGPFPKNKPYFNNLIEKTTGINEKSMEFDVSLKEELQDFVETDNRFETLESLKFKLTSSRGELNKLVSSLNESMVFSEDVKTSMLHKTIKKLINVSKNELHQENLRLLANECLGLIGPVDLKTMVVNFGDNDELEKDVKCSLIKNILNYVINEDHETSNSAIFGLKRVLGTMNSGYQMKGYQNVLIKPFSQVFSEADRESKSNLTMTSQNLKEAVQKMKFWPYNHDHDLWITGIVVKLLSAYPEVPEAHLKNTSHFGRHLLSLASKQPQFCTVIFPWLVHDILNTSKIDITPLSNGLAGFFKNYYEHKIIQDTKCVETMLNLVKFLRMQSRKLGSSWEDNFWIEELDYLHVAFGAFKKHDYISSLLFCEIWCHNNVEQNGIIIDHLKKSIIDGLYEYYENIGASYQIECINKCQNLMADSYMALGMVSHKMLRITIFGLKHLLKAYFFTEYVIFLKNFCISAVL